MTDDTHWMRKALREAQRAKERGDVPVGAVVVKDQQLISAAGNRRHSSDSPLAHAEVRAIEDAAKELQRWKLHGCTLYVTVEPCPMCAGALVETRIDRVVFGARQPDSGAARSLYQLLDDPRRTHQLTVTEGILACQSQALLQSFFQSRRI